MKTMARLALFGVTALLAVPQGAQAQTLAPPPGEVQPESGFPYAPPPNFDPRQVPQPDSEAQQGPEITEVPEELPPAEPAPESRGRRRSQSRR